jgi:hypothetical protein
MEHVKPLTIKALATLVVLYMVLGMGFGMAFENVLLITLVLGAVSYFAGDLIILPKTNNITATFSDAVVSFLVIVLMAMAFGFSFGEIVLYAILSATLITIFEFYFHIYIVNKEVGMNRTGDPKWQTDN